MTPSVSTAAAVRANRATIAAFAGLVGLIGTNLVAIRIGNRELAPFWHAGFRFLVAAMLFWLIAVLRRAGLPSRRARRVRYISIPAYAPQIIQKLMNSQSRCISAR